MLMSFAKTVYLSVTGDQRGEALAVVELLERQRQEAWVGDCDWLRLSKAAEALEESSSRRRKEWRTTSIPLATK